MALSQDVKEDTNGNAFVNLNDSAGTGLTSTLTGGKQALDINIAGGSSSGAVADKTTFTYGTTSETPVGGVFQDTSPTLTAGQTGAMRLTSNRELHINLRSAGAEIGTSGSPVRTDPTGTTTQPISAASLPLPTGAATEATLSSLNDKHTSSTSTLTQVAASTSSVSILASNANRKGWVLVNDSNKIAFVAFAATATSAAYTYKINANSTLEPQQAVYTGAISAIWKSGVTGNMVITELT